MQGARRPLASRRRHAGTTTAVLLAVICLVTYARAGQPHTQSYKAPVIIGAAAAGLDGTGRTIPTTHYAIPRNAIFMAPGGEDDATGSRDSPVRTLHRAYTLVPTGGTVVARGGTYRDGGLTVHKAFTLQAYPGEHPWFDGTDLVSAWTADGAGLWYTSWSTPDFCANAQHPVGGYYEQTWPWSGTPAPSGPCIHPDMVKDPANPAAGDPQMVWMDGAYLPEVTNRHAVSAATFFYDVRHRRIYLGTDPLGHRVEIAKRPSALVSVNLRGGNQVLGIGFRRFASNQKHEGSVTHGAVTVQSTASVTFENDVFAWNAGAGLNFMGAPPHARVRHSTFAYNGFNGLDANGSEHHDDFSVTDSRFNHNNAEMFGLDCSRSCGAAGSKMAHMDGVTIRDNIFEDSQGAASGFWCDLHCSHARIVGNVFANNGNVGLLYEVSERALIVSNLVFDNGYYLGRQRPDGTLSDRSDMGAGIRVSAANTKIYNNTVIGNVPGLIIYDDARSPGAPCGGCRYHDVGPDTRNLDVVNNVFATGRSRDLYAPYMTASLQRLPGRGVPGTPPAEFYRIFDDNTYYRPDGAPKLMHLWGDASPSGSLRTFRSVAALRRTTGLEHQGRDLRRSVTQFFRDTATGNYCPRSSGPAATRGRTLPIDVAAQVGVPAGGNVDRGILIVLGIRCEG